MLARESITYNKTESTPLEFNEKITPLDGTPPDDATLYKQKNYSVVYLIITRFDIAYDVCIVSQFKYAPRSSHFYADL